MQPQVHVKRVHADSAVDGYRRPLVGAAAAPERSAPGQ